MEMMEKIESESHNGGGSAMNDGLLRVGHFEIILILTIVPIMFHLWNSYNSISRLVSKIPGPTPLPLIGNALEFLSVDNTKMTDKLIQLVADYNGTARIWLGNHLLILLSDPKDIEICLHSSKMIEKGPMYSFFEDMLGQGLLNARGDIWKKHRRVMTPAFHTSVLKLYLDIFQYHSEKMVKRLETQQGQFFNVFPIVRDCAIDFITETALESKVYAQEGTQQKETEAAERMMTITYDRLFKVWLHSDFLFYLTKKGQEYRALGRIINQSIEPKLMAKKKEIENETEEVDKRRSMLRQMVELTHTDQLTDKELRDEVMTIIITGYETTTATVSFIILLLGIHQDVQEQVYEEIRGVQGDDPNKTLAWEDLADLKYMDMVIKETLRLYPVGPSIFRKATADVQLKNCVVPKGSSVAMIFLHTHRRPDLWTDPDVFNPLNFSPEEVAKRPPYSFNGFSAGPRGCIGQKYAEISMKVMLYNILSKYRILTDMKQEDMKPKIDITLKLEGGFPIRVEPRFPQ